MCTVGALVGENVYQLTCKAVAVPIRRAKPKDVMALECIALFYDFGVLSIVLGRLVLS